MKFFLIILTMLVSSQVKADLVKLVLCRGEVLQNNGIAKQCFFNLTSDYVDVFKINANNQRYLDVRTNDFEIGDIFENYQTLSCSDSVNTTVLYGIDRSNVINIKRINLAKITVHEEIFSTLYSYLGILDGHILRMSKKNKCRCLTFNLDFDYQDLGGDSIETYYLISLKNKRKTHDLVNRIDQYYRVRKPSKSRFGAEITEYREIVKQIINEFQRNRVQILIHYY